MTCCDDHVYELPARLHHQGKPHIDVRGNGAVMRLRDADIDCTTGNLRQVRQSLTDARWR